MQYEAVTGLENHALPISEIPKNRPGMRLSTTDFPYRRKSALIFR